MTREPVSAQGPEPPSGDVAVALFEHHPYGILVLEHDGTVVAGNRAACAMLGGDGRRGLGAARELLAFDGGPARGRWLVERALSGDAPLPEVRLDLPPGSAGEAAWVTVAPLGDSSRVLVELRPASRDDRRRRTEPHWALGPRLRISALGRTRVESPETSVGGRWLDNRAGQLFKLLVAERYRAISAEQIAEELWPDPSARSLQGVRYFVHALREHLEPGRPPRTESSFVRFIEGGYALDRTRVSVDADEFETAVVAGRAAREAGDLAEARARYQDACRLYRGDFLADEPYAEWALPERDRLRSLAAEALRALAAMADAEGDLEAAAAHLERLGSVERYDVDVHRALIEICLRRGRRSEALRRYTSLRHRLLSVFGEDLDFTLANLTTNLASAEERLRVLDTARS